MSWVIERLLVDYNEIKERGDFESDLYSLLLTLEMRLERLDKKGLLSSDEIELIQKLGEKKTITRLSKDLGLSRISTSNKIDMLTKKLSMALGGVFTDEGYVEFLAEQYNLDVTQQKKILDRITGAYKRIYMR